MDILEQKDLMLLTRILTRDNKEDVENMFRRACFNVFSHNRDDHAKNFSFLYDEKFFLILLAHCSSLNYISSFHFYLVS